MVGARTATSRYTRLREDLDSSIFNSNWEEIEIEGVAPRNDYYFGDLFSGAGGLSVGMKGAGFKKVFSIETNPYASQTIRRNFPESIHFESDIELVSNDQLLKTLEGKKIDVVVGGPPCQGFSVAGHRRIDDPRNKLFLEYCRVVEALQPKYFVMENVPGILTMQKGTVKVSVVITFGTDSCVN